MFSHFGEPMNGWTLMLRIAVAVFVGAIIGAEREMKNRPAGMRTHVLVCLGAAIVALIEQMAIAQAVQLQAVGLINVSIGRITASVVSGVGFLGAGTIVLSERHICGLTTAASLWCTACIGLAAGAGYFGIGRSGRAEADAESRADYDLQTFGSAVYPSDGNAGVSQ